MMMNDPLGDMLTRIRNAQMRGKSTVSTPASKLRAWVLDVLVSEVSKPGRRVYMGVSEIPSVRNGLGVSIVSTPKGVMSDAAARSANVGGEVLCTVF
jgi:small subunit ribosomal protein S8